MLDHNLEVLRGADWDPLAPTTTPPGRPGPDAAPGADAAAMVRGFGLATLEFMATAARDDSLIGELRHRVQVMIDAHGRVAAAHRPAGEALPVDQVARLMTALDQGVSVLMLSGIASMDGTLLRTGLRRLLDPARAATEPAPDRDGPTTPLPDVAHVHRLIRNPPGS